MVGWIRTLDLKRNVASECQALAISPRSYLRSHPFGVYTVAAIADRRVEDWAFHWQRLVQGASELVSFEIECRSIVQEFKIIHGSVTILVTEWKVHFLAHSSAARFKTLLSSSSIAVWLTTEVQRENPQIKFSKWILDRSPFENTAYQECLIGRQCEDGDVELLEGFVTNLFLVYRGGTLRTAASQLVLSGVMRQRVIDICQEHHLELCFKPILWSERSQWLEGFVTNAIRKLQPIASVVYQHETYTFPKLNAKSMSSLISDHVMKSLSKGDGELDDSTTN